MEKCFWMYIYLVSFGASLASSESMCYDVGDCVSECKEKCGCDRSVLYYYNETTNECLLDFKQLMNIVVEKYNNQEKIRVEAERVFNGILVSALLFVTCAAVCALTACIYCCHVNYSDQVLHKNVKELAAKLGRDKGRKEHRKKETKPAAEACNIMLQDVFMC